MGSHPWKFATAYVPDIAHGLVQAQRETFERGEYGQVRKLKLACASMGVPAADLPPEPTAHSIDEARMNDAESGTCSVLDVYSVGETPEPGVTAPFPEDVVLQACGSATPTLEQAKSSLLGLWERLGRGESGYIVCHEDGKPSHYLFIGMSFD